MEDTRYFIYTVQKTVNGATEMVTGRACTTGNSFLCNRHFNGGVILFLLEVSAQDYEDFLNPDAKIANPVKWSV